MKPVDILNSMILLFQHNNWNRNYWALNKDNVSVHPDSPNVISYCLGGALIRICSLNRVPKRIEEEVDTIIRRQIPSHSIVGHNDRVLQSKEEVIEFLEKVRKSVHIE